jgi:GT2 family glycosyltransferase
MVPDAVPVSVVIPTVGRAELLARCLESVASCVPPPDEIVVVDQSGHPDVATVVARFGERARLVSSPGRGVSRSRNAGLLAARNEVVLVTDDDCTVEPDWVGAARRLTPADGSTILTGRVLPVGDPSAVPSTIDEPTRRDYTGELRGGLLFGNNMVLPRLAVLAEDGGFDERFGPDEAAEDNEFCYRWLKAGKTIVYEPELVVHHHDWRTPAELEALYVRYARGEGFFYAKHLRRGDLRILRFIVRDVYWSLRGLLAALVKRRQRWTDFRRAILKGMPYGFRDGWRTFGGR